MISNFLNKYDYLHGESSIPRRCVLNRGDMQNNEVKDGCLVKSTSCAFIRTVPYNQNECSMQETESVDGDYSQSLNDSQLPSLN